MNYYESAKRVIKSWESLGITSEYDLILGLTEFQTDVYLKGPTYIKTEEFKLIYNGLTYQGLQMISKENPKESEEILKKSLGIPEI